MLREEQIDLRRQRARAANLAIENLGKNRVFSDYRVTNPQTKGQYTVTVRGFDTGDNACTCPDFKSNTLGTCKHIEAVLERLQSDGEAVKRRKAAVVRPEVTLDYGAAQLRLKLQLPPRRSDPLDALAERFFDDAGFWSGRRGYDELVTAIESVPEQVTVMSDAMDFIDREVERREMARRERGIGRVLVVAPASVKYQWEGEIRKFTDRSVQVVEGLKEAREELYAEDA